MRIVHVIDSLDPAVGGPRAVVFSLAGAQALAGDDVRIVGYHAHTDGPDRTGRNSTAGMQHVRLVPLFERRSKLRPLAAKDARTLREAVTTADIVHLHGVWDPVLLHAATLARSCDTPYVITPHGMLDRWSLSVKPFKKRIALLMGRRSMVTGAQAVHALSEHERECITAGRFHEQVMVVPNGINLSDIDPVPEKGRFRAAHPELGNDPYVLLLARLHAVKGLDILADAFARLLPKHPGLRLVIAGPDEGAAGSLRSQVQRLGIADRVHLVGPLYGRSKLEAYADAAAFCLPSKHEAFSMSIAEALACRTPVIISRECNLPIVAEARAGRVVNRDARSIADAIDGVLTDPAAAAEAAGRGRELIESRFIWSTIAKQIRSLYVSTAAVQDAPEPVNIAIITNVETPYRVALHRRFIREIKQIHLSTLYTHGVPDQAWTTPLAQDINPVAFGTADAVESRTSPRKVLNDFKKSGRIIDWIIHNRVQAVFLSGYNDVGRLRLFRWCHGNGIPVFLVADSNIHGDRAVGFRRFVKGLVVNRVVRWCSAVLPFGTAGARYFYRYGADADKVVFCPYEPDYDMIESLEPDAIAAAGAKFNLAPDRRRLVYCGRMQPVKRPDLAIEGFLRVTDRLPNWDLVMIGDGPLMAKCRAMVPDAIKHRVNFVGFLGDQREISAIYRQSDILVIPSDADAWGLVVNEATQAGMAVVASNVVGAVPELVREGVNGAIFRRGDPDDLAAAIVRMADPAVLDAAKAASRGVIADWRKRGDPVVGMRLALARVGVLRPGAGLIAHTPEPPAH